MKNFDQIFLTREEKRILRRIRFGLSVRDSDALSTLITDYCFVLRHYDRVVDDTTQNVHRVPNGEFSLTKQYERYLLYRKDLFFSGKLPVIISIFALIGAYRGEIFSVIQAVMQLLR